MNLQIGDVAPISRRNDRRDLFVSTNGSAIPGSFCSRIPRFHARLHHRARSDGQAEGGIRRARRCKIIGFCVDPVSHHAHWAKDIEETQGDAPNFPMIGDPDLKVAKLYGMMPSAMRRDGREPQRHDNQTVRNVFVIGPDKKMKLLIVYPMSTGRNFDEVLRVIDSLQMTAKHKVATPANWWRARMSSSRPRSATKKQRGSFRPAGRRSGPICG